jgi:glutamine synthetase
MEANLREFLEISYDELESLNLEAKKKARERLPQEETQAHYSGYLEKEKRIKAVTLCFSDIEGRFHSLDYDKKYFLKSSDNLTFDGSSVRGFTEQHQSDLRLIPDWHTFRWLPADVFGPGKVLMFACVADQHGEPHPSDMRSRLKNLLQEMYLRDKMEFLLAPELEGFVVQGKNAEQNFDEKTGFRFMSEGGYYHTLPTCSLKQFIDRAAEAQRSMGFENEKDHPEVAPSQFELNYSYTEALLAADQIQLYKLTGRQIAHDLNMTATFLPKPFIGINGSGMHTNISLARDGKNLFYAKDGKHNLSLLAWNFIGRLLHHASEICLVFNSSVNAYRRLDPKFEAPNQIRVSATDRGAMIRLPIGNERTTRLEVRSVGPDSNPYLVAYILLRTGLEGTTEVVENGGKILPADIHEALEYFKVSELTTRLLTPAVKEKYIQWKQAAADRVPRNLGKTIKNGEILYHHEITNQVLWNTF